MKAAELCSLLYTEQRLKSFKKWPFDPKSTKTKTQNTCTSVNLAKAGYIFFEDNCATCVFCGKTLEFEPQDNPFNEHRSHSPNCVFLEMMEKDETEWTVKEFEVLIAALCTRECLTTVKRWQEELLVQGRKVRKRIEPFIDDNN
uniref:Uncharacterized protein n=1 Tax=Panagrolaimus sp. JU765 TaxID=591449 RepID=A0AC34QU69_9BILA